MAQHSAAHCSALPHNAAHCNTLHGNRLQSSATHCRALQLTATHCNSLQQTTCGTAFGIRAHGTALKLPFAMRARIHRSKRCGRTHILRPAMGSGISGLSNINIHLWEMCVQYVAVCCSKLQCVPLSFRREYIVANVVGGHIYCFPPSGVAYPG